MQTDNGLLNWFFSCTERAKSEQVQAGLNLLDELQCLEIEDEDLVLQHDHQHVFPQFDVSDFTPGIKSDFRAILLLVIIPNDYFVFLRCENKDNNIALALTPEYN